MDMTDTETTLPHNWQKLPTHRVWMLLADVDSDDDADLVYDELEKRGARW